MFIKFLTAFSTIALLVQSAPSEERAEIPQSPPPRFIVVAQIDRDSSEITCLEVVRTVTVEMRPAAVSPVSGDLDAPNLSGPAKVPVNVEKNDLKNDKVSLDQWTVLDLSGAKVDKKHVLTRLKVGDTLLISVDGKPVDRAYHGVLKKDTLILVPPTKAPARTIPPVG